MNTTELKVTAVLLLACIITLLVAGIFHRAYKDNALQTLGMCGMLVWAGSEVSSVLRGAYTSPFDIVQYASILSFSFGVAVKVLKHHRAHPDADPTSPQEFAPSPHHHH